MQARRRPRRLQARGRWGGPALAALACAACAAVAIPAPAASVALTGGVRLVARDREAASGDRLVARYRGEAGLAALVDPRCPATTTLQVVTDARILPPIALDCAGWVPAGPGFKYVAKPAGAGSLVKVVYKPERLTIKLKGIPYADAPVTGPIEFLETRLSIDDGMAPTDYCGRWDTAASDLRRNDPDRVVARGPSVPCVADVLFASDFEADELFPPDRSGWHDVQLQTPPGEPAAFWEQIATTAHGGARSVHFFAPPGGGGLNCGKADFVRHDLDIQAGQTVEYRGWFRLDVPAAQAPVFLFDAECPGDVCGFAGSPGVRLRINAHGRLEVDWKFLNWFANNGMPPPADAPPPAPDGAHDLPIGAWFEVLLRLRLGKGAAGLTQVYVNGALDSSVVGTNIAPDGMDTLDRYPNLQVGITCNGEGNAPADLFVDDVRVTRTD